MTLCCGQGFLRQILEIDLVHAAEEVKAAFGFIAVAGFPVFHL